jgi:hypothetical protein
MGYFGLLSIQDSLGTTSHCSRRKSAKLRRKDTRFHWNRVWTVGPLYPRWNADCRHRGALSSLRSEENFLTASR